MENIVNIRFKDQGNNKILNINKLNTTRVRNGEDICNQRRMS